MEGSTLRNSFLLLALAILAVGQVQACSDQIPADMCLDMKNAGYCTSLPAKAAEYCSKTCNLCQEPPPEMKPTPAPGSNCGGANHLKRKANIAVFVSSKLARVWRQKWRMDLNQALRTLTIPQLNRWYTPRELGIEIKFQLVIGSGLSGSEDNYIRNQMYKKRNLGSQAGVASFCEFLGLRRRQGYYRGKTWALAIYLVEGNSEGRRLKQGAAGIVRMIGGVCKNKAKYNCGIVNGYARHKGIVFDRLLAHEVGHLMGFVHPIQEGRRDCTDGLMTSPGSTQKWSTCTRARAARTFSNRWVYPCMPYQCGQMPAPTQLPGGVLPADKRVLTQVCKRFYNDGKDWEFDGPMKFRPIRNPRHDLAWILYQNPKWYLASRVCYGIPCKVEGGPVGGVKGIYMNGKPCGVNKKCKNQVYGKRVTSARCQ